MAADFRKLSCALLGAAMLCASPASAQVRPVYDAGAAGLARVLQQLQTTASVMHTGAHPDDEDSGLLAYLARGEYARTSYISLTRGGGGQNVIGPELSEALGVIRTEELLQARRLDGATQLFTRAIDYGFSKYLSEATRLWDEELLLGDMVRAIRSERPMVIVSRWAGTPADGHGHHQFAGYLTPLAFAAAADPDRFTEHFAEGLTPWQADKLYVSQGFRPDPDNVPDLLLNTGKHDVMLGRSYFEVAMEGRSQQKTQQMGSLELRGRQDSGIRLITSLVAAPAIEQSIFDGIDTTIRGIAAYEHEASKDLVRMLQRLEDAAANALRQYNSLSPQDLVKPLVDGLQLARRAGELAHDPAARELLRQKAREFESALLLATGVRVDALSDSETVVAGSSLQAAVRVYVPENIAAVVTRINLSAPDGWAVTPAPGNELAGEEDRRRQDQPIHAGLFDIAVPADATPTQPYWLERPRGNFEFDWSTADGAVNQAFRPALLSAEVNLTISGIEVRVRQAAEFRALDRVRGELRRPVNVVPALSVAPSSDMLIVPTSSTQRDYQLLQTITNHADGGVAGSTTFDVPPGWTLQPRREDFSLAGKKTSATVVFTLTVPEGTAPGSYPVTAVTSAGGQEYRQTLREIDYPHIQTHRVYQPSTVKANVVDVRVAPVSVGYVMGSGDKVPEAVRRLGLDVTLLSDDDLATGDLAGFDTIVVGIRASQMRPAFVANNQRLLDFAGQGGTLIVQYQQSDYVTQNLAPFPASMDTNVRVVDETAPVTILEPNHAVFNFPNKIVAADFDGWVQERNGYTFSDFDHEHYTPLLESHDEGDPASVGGMVYAKLGRGIYVYSSYAWFRQLPQGVPGSYRIFANLLSLPEAE